MSYRPRPSSQKTTAPLFSFMHTNDRDDVRIPFEKVDINDLIPSAARCQQLQHEFAGQPQSTTTVSVNPSPTRAIRQQEYQQCTNLEQLRHQEPHRQEHTGFFSFFVKHC